MKHTFLFNFIFEKQTHKHIRKMKWGFKFQHKDTQQIPLKNHINSFIFYFWGESIFFLVFFF